MSTAPDWLVARVVATGAVAGCLLVAAITAAGAQESRAPIDDGQRRVDVRASVKASGLIARWPDNAWLFPDRGTTTGFWRVRVEPTLRLNAATYIDLAYEHRLRASTSASALGASAALPPATLAPYRVNALDWQIGSSARSSWRHEIDRAALHTRVSRADVTVGRQAIGWGRGVMFSAMDLLSPFTPLEADREWRRGVDAVRIDTKISNRGSVDLVGAFASSIDRSFVGGRWRSYSDRVDLEVIGGWRARDRFVGAASSGAVAGAEIHGEVVAFAAPAVPDSMTFAAPRTVMKIVVGGSRRLAVGHGVLAELEYHYSGFGRPASSELAAWVRDAEFQRRHARGDLQTLGRHTIAGLGQYEASPLLSAGGQWVHSLVDRSGVVIPSVTVTVGDRWALVVRGYVPYGRPPVGVLIRSEYGQTPFGVFAQIRFDR